jgi:hypothetical protein
MLKGWTVPIRLHPSSRVPPGATLLRFPARAHLRARPSRFSFRPREGMKGVNVERFGHDLDLGARQIAELYGFVFELGAAAVDLSKDIFEEEGLGPTDKRKSRQPRWLNVAVVSTIGPL